MKLLKRIFFPEITIVTVVFKKELPLLYLQARSIKRFAKINLSKIIVIVNDCFSDSEIKELYKTYLTIFGTKVKFEIVLGETLIYEEYVSDILGWRAQQILKLNVHRNIQTSYYLTLDAKNHLIRNLNNRDLFVRGKPIIFTKNKPGSIWAENITNCKKLLEIPTKNKLDYFIVPATPYMLITEEVKKLGVFLGSKNTSIVDAISKRGATEYLLYYLHLSKGEKTDSLYSFKKINEKNTVTFFAKAPDSEREMFERLRLLRSEDIKWLGIHRNRFVLDYEFDIKKDVIEVWRSSGLFESAESAEVFWDSYKRSLL